MQSVENAHFILLIFMNSFKVVYFWDLRSYVLITEHKCGNAEMCDDDVEHYCKQALTGPRAGVWGIGVAGRCLSRTLAQGQYMAQGCKSLVIAAAPKVLARLMHGFCAGKIICPICPTQGCCCYLLLQGVQTTYVRKMTAATIH